MNSQTSKSFILLLTVILLVSSLVSCNHKESGDFGIYIAETQEIVISGDDISAFSLSENAFTLNDTGIEKWNSYQTYPDIPKLNDTLFDREFTIIIDGEELCRGKFWSLVSSSAYSGWIILDALFKLDEYHDTVRLQHGYPGSSGEIDPKVTSQLSDYFEDQGKLKQRE